MAGELKYNCVFGGGGIRGMCYIGAIKAMKEYNLKINSLAGSSVGSVFAALYAVGYNEDEIKNLFFNFNFNMFRDLNIGIFSADISLSKGEIFLDWLREKIGKKVLGNVYSSEKKVTFSDIDCNLQILTLDLNTNMPYVFSKENTPNEEIAFAVRCSAGLPGLMKPINYNGMLLVDGDLIKSWPAWKIYDEFNTPDTRLLEFRLEGSRDGSDVKNPIDYLNSIINVVWYLSTENVFNLYSNNDRYDFVIIDTKNVILFDFAIDKDTKEKLIDIGYYRTKEFISKSLVNKKQNLLKIYKRIFREIHILQKEVKKKNLNETFFIINEILANMNDDKQFIDNLFIEQIISVKQLFLKSIKKQFLFCKKFENEDLLIEKINFLQQLLKNRIDEINEFVINSKNIS